MDMVREHMETVGVREDDAEDRWWWVWGWCSFDVSFVFSLSSQPTFFFLIWGCFYNGAYVYWQSFSPLKDQTSCGSLYVPLTRGHIWNMFTLSVSVFVLPVLCSTFYLVLIFCFCCFYFLPCVSLTCTLSSSFNQSPASCWLSPSRINCVCLLPPLPVCLRSQWQVIQHSPHVLILLVFFALFLRLGIYLCLFDWSPVIRPEWITDVWTGLSGVIHFSPDGLVLRYNTVGGTLLCGMFFSWVLHDTWYSY